MPSSVINTPNIQVEVGIISTPVIDPKTNTLYVVAKTYENSVQIFRLHALDILNQGAEKFGGPKQIAAQYPGSGTPNDGAGHVLFVAGDPFAYYIRRSGRGLPRNRWGHPPAVPALNVSSR